MEGLCKGPELSADAAVNDVTKNPLKHSLLFLKTYSALLLW